MKTEEDNTPLRVRSLYDPAYGELLFTILARCRREHPRLKKSQFYRNEILGTVRPNAHRFFDEFGKNPGLLTRKAGEADQKAFNRYLESGGSSAPDTLHQLVHAYLQLKVPERLTVISPFQASDAAGRAVGGFLCDSESSASAVESRRTTDIDKNILAVFAMIEPKRYLVFLRGSTPDFMLCLLFKLRPDEEDNLQLQIGFCVPGRGTPLVVMSALRSHERFHGHILGVNGMAEFGAILHLELLVNHRESHSDPRMEESLARRWGQSSRVKVSGVREENPSIINSLQQKIARFREELIG